MARRGECILGGELRDIFKGKKYKLLLAVLW